MNRSRRSLAVCIAAATAVATTFVLGSARPSDALSRAALVCPNSAGFSVSGNTMVDPCNDVMRFRGVHILQPSTPVSAFPHDVTSSDVHALANEWGANAVRIQMDEESWLESSACGFTFPSRLQALVNDITALHMLAILDLHTSNPQGYNCTTPGQVEPMPDSQSTTFWQQVSATYWCNPYVAFEMFNEPGDLSINSVISDSVWKDGGSVTDVSHFTYTTPGFQALVNTIAATNSTVSCSGGNPTHLIFADGIDGANYLTNLFATDCASGNCALSGPNIVYAVHGYDPLFSFATGTVPSLVNPVVNDWLHSPFCTPYDGSVINSYGWARAATTYPVMVTEFGSNCLGGASTYMTSAIAQFERNSLGWIAYSWFPLYCLTPGQGGASSNCYSGFQENLPQELGTVPPYHCGLSLATVGSTPRDTTCTLDFGLINDWTTHAPTDGGLPVYIGLKANAADG